MQQQFISFLNNWQTYLPIIRENSVIIFAIILLFVIWALKSQIKRQNRHFLHELKQEFNKQIQDTPKTEHTSNYIKASLIEQKVLVHQDLVNLKAERMVEQQSLGENGLSAKRYYYYFKEFKDIVINNRFYLTQETEFVFSQIMQDHAASLLKLKHLENEFVELANEAPTDRYAFEQLIEQETMTLEAFYQDSRAEMERFLAMIDDDVLKLRAEIDG